MIGILLNKKNIKIRYNKDKKYINTIINNIISRDQYINKKISLKYIIKKKKLKNTSISKIKNKCLFSGRNKAVLKKFKLSRMFLKNLGLMGYINGLKKSSW